MSNTPFDHTPPYASSIVESLRAFGYDLPTAIADVVDNSISAGAKNIWIQFEWAGGDSVISVTDDGHGMTAKQLINAMRLGSRSPLSERKEHDLGRFGLGLNTASLSQCRRLTVFSRRTSTPLVTRCWDLDTIATTNDWRLLHTADENATSYFRSIRKLVHGTTVLWQQLDRLTVGQNVQNADQQQRFLDRIEGVRLHLEMVFHRLMTGDNAVRIYINGRRIKPWDPFLEDLPATHALPTERIRCGAARIVVKAFVLPHRSKLTDLQYNAAAGPRGWLAHQGFYIYRRDRLLVAGDWLFGWAKDEYLKLARIAVELPNSLDYDWQIDVTKSRATPPAALRESLLNIAARTREQAKRVFTHRGAKLTPHEAAPRTLLWEPHARHDKTFYRINRDHPLIKAAKDASKDKPTLNAMLRLIEETIPLQHITIANSEKPDSQPQPFEGTSPKQIREVIAQAYNSLCSSGYSACEAKERLQTLWPFELFPEIVATIND